jgi:hypothetical protein
MLGLKNSKKAVLGEGVGVGTKGQEKAQLQGRVGQEESN